jgi:hypothetical protein
LNYLPGLAWNPDPPDLNLPNSWNYRQEPLAPGSFVTIFIKIIPSLGNRGSQRLNIMPEAILLFVSRVVDFVCLFVCLFCLGGTGV